MSVNQIHQVVADDLAKLNEKIIEQLHSQVPLIEDIGKYLIAAGGKRIRPVLVLLHSNNLGYPGDQHIDLAIVIEFLHTATLLHDDVVDMSEMRRGKPTVNTRWDNPSSVLTGDFIYARAFELLVGIGNIDIMAVMARATTRTSEGEVLQLVHQHNTAAGENDYMDIISDKTAILFAAACKSAVILAEGSQEDQKQAHAFGLHLGLAFQLIDDVLDFTGTSSVLGKNVGDDLAQGRLTLPLIYAMSHGNDQQRKLIRRVIEKGGAEELEEVMEAVVDAVKSSGALDYTREQARKQIAKALPCLESLPANKYRDGLELVAATALNRDS